MPLYEYQCDACGHRFETIRKFSDAPLETCPKCGGVVRKLQSAPAFQFKGSGWYVTDYAKKDGESAGKSGDAPAAKNAPAAGEASNSTKADSSPSAAPSTSESTKTAS